MVMYQTGGVILTVVDHGCSSVKGVRCFQSEGGVASHTADCCVAPTVPIPAAIGVRAVCFPATRGHRRERSGPLKVESGDAEMPTGWTGTAPDALNSLVDLIITVLRGKRCFFVCALWDCDMVRDSVLVWTR